MAAILSRYPADRKRAAMLPALRLVQEMKGYLTPETLALVAERLGVAPAAAGEVATFYTMLRVTPVGRYVIDLCTNVSCSLCGGERLLRHLERRLGVPVGGTTPDGKFTLREVECLASCGTAPVLQLNEEYHERLTPETVDALLDSLP